MQTRLQREYAKARDRSPTHTTNHAVTTSEDETPNTANRASRIWNSIGDIFAQPYLLANTAMTLTGGFYLSSHLLSAGVAAYAEKVAAGDQLTLIQSGVSVIALLCGTMGMKMLADQRNATRNELKRGTLEKALADLVLEVRQELRDQRSLSDEVHDTVTMLAASSKDTWHPRANEGPTWNRFAPGHPLYTIRAHCSAEIVTKTLDADGNKLLIGNEEHIRICWVPRYSGTTKLSSVHHICYGVNIDDDPIETGLLRMLGVYRLTRDVAVKHGIEVDFSNVRIALIEPKQWQDQSTFLGHRETSGSRDASPVVMRYSTIPSALAKNTSNKTVLVNYSPDTHSEHLGLADELVQDAQCVLTLEEAEARFGDRVPAFANGTNRPITLSGPKPLGNVYDHYGEYSC